MRRIAAGLALALSVSLSFTAQADPGRSQYDDPPPPGQAAAPTTPALNPSWKRWGPAPWPAPRMSAYSVVDPSHDRMVVFGGWGSGYFSDTWMLDLASDTWTQPAADTVHPGPRMEYASTHDPVRNRMIVFGGKDPYTSEVWALSLSGTPAWTRLTTAGTSPSPRESRAIYDPVRDRMVVFGGYGPYDFPHHLNETWELALSGTPTWRQLSTTGAPPARRRGQTAILDPAGDRMIVFGGYDDVAFMNDVWSLDLGTLAWQQLAPGGDVPSGRYGHSATFDPDRREMVVFGGYDGAWLDDHYVLSLGDTPAWTRATSAPRPSPRDFHSAVYDAPRHRIVLFGGNAGPVFNDVWALDTGTRTWTRLGPNLTGPAPRLGTYAVTDQNSQRMVLFGGWGNAYFGDTWTLALNETPPRWDPVETFVHPSARLEHTTAYDAARDRMLLFGGKDAYRFFNDVWQLDLTGVPTWSPIATAGVPPSPRESRAIYDPVRDRLLLFGGFSYPYHLNETWELTLSGTPTWHQLFPEGLLPEPRRGQSLIYDPVGDRVLLFGGYDDTKFFYDVWALEFQGQPHWVPIPTLGVGPGPRYGATATYDPVRRQMIVFGGYDGHYLDDAFALSLDQAPKWTSIVADPHPGPTDFHTMAYDPDRDRFLLFGGNDGHPLGELWELGFGSPILLPPSESLTGGEPVLRVLGATLDRASGAAVVRFRLPDASPARIELYDVTGRRLASRSYTPAGPGRNAVSLSEAGALHAGIYFVRVSQGTRSAVGRAVITP